MIGFKEFIMTAITAQKEKCPEGYRFSKKLGVCVPKGHRTYYPFYGYRNGGNGNDNQNQNQNGNGANGNGSNGNGSNGNGGNGGNGNGNGS